MPGRKQDEKEKKEVENWYTNKAHFPDVEFKDGSKPRKIYTLVNACKRVSVTDRYLIFTHWLDHLTDMKEKGFSDAEIREERGKADPLRGLTVKEKEQLLYMVWSVINATTNSKQLTTCGFRSLDDLERWALDRRSDFNHNGVLSGDNGGVDRGAGGDDRRDRGTVTANKDKEKKKDEEEEDDFDILEVDTNENDPTPTDRRLTRVENRVAGIESKVDTVLRLLQQPPNKRRRLNSDGPADDNGLTNLDYLNVSLNNFRNGIDLNKNSYQKGVIIAGQSGYGKSNIINNNNSNTCNNISNINNNNNNTCNNLNNDYVNHYNNNNMNNNSNSNNNNINNNNNNINSNSNFNGGNFNNGFNGNFGISGVSGNNNISNGSDMNVVNKIGVTLHNAITGAASVMPEDTHKKFEKELANGTCISLYPCKFVFEWFGFVILRGLLGVMVVVCNPF